MRKLICRLLGHKMNVYGINSRWCSRCAHREMTGYDPSRVNALIRSLMKAHNG